MNDNYLDKLNEQQRAAVEYLDGPELVIAGAGSGKTRVLTYKIVHLLVKGYQPGRIMALTFTNKAAREMQERIEAIVGVGTSKRLWMGTFHSIFSRILRQNFDKIGYTRNYTIYDAADSKSLIKTIIKELDLDDKIYKPSTVQNAISWAKNALVSPAAYAADRELVEADTRSRRPRIAEIYKVYVNRCRLSDAMDFDDLLYYTAVLFRDNPGVLGHYREYFQYILVDEYQDTNFAQNTILTMLGKPAGNLCVVGDDAQSIYSFRGANIRNILDLERSFPTLRTFKLEQNYRSTRNITGAANSLIAHNVNQIRKEVFSRGETGDRIEVQSGHSDYDEAGLVAAAIVTRRARRGDPLSEYAILYRTNAQSRVLEEALRRRNIAYRIYGGQAFYQRKEVKDAVSYFRMAVNPRDDEALRRVINVPARSIGKVTVDKLTATAIQAGVSIWDVLKEPARHGLDVNAGTLRKLQGFTLIIDRFIDLDRSGCNAYELARHIMTDTGLIAMYRSDNTPENISKRENLEELVKGAHEFVEDSVESGEGEHISMADFLTKVSLATDQDEESENTEVVTLMTIHAAKGLEFNNVYVVGVEEDLLPSAMSHDSAEAVEEERRLFYVAITRAKEFCMLSYALSRYMNGQTMTCRPSRFLKDIESKFLKYSYGAERLPYELNLYRTKTEPSAPRTASPTPTQQRPIFINQPSSRPAVKSDAGSAMYVNHTLDELAVGMEIVHPKFGRGQLVMLDDSPIGPVAIANFDSSGERKLLLKFAKFKIAGK